MIDNIFKYRFIFAAGGTGGHLFPAIAVAEKIKELKPESEILFVGTKDKLEAEIIPKLGYAFDTLWISGFARSFNFNNLIFPVKVLASAVKALKICISFKPAAAVGAGAYVSGPIIWAAKVFGAKAALLEQNSYPGITNRLLDKKADKIFISYDESAKYFRDPSRLINYGNPVRTITEKTDRTEALKKFNLNPDKKTVLILGGSLGAASINKAVAADVQKFEQNNIQIIWQCGKRYYEEYKKYQSGNTAVLPFIENMPAAYSACDIVAARAGATTIAEIANLSLPAVLIPSPNVAADHQTKNAEALVKKQAAVLINDSDASEKLFDTVKDIIGDDAKLKSLGENIAEFSSPDAAGKIAAEIIKLSESR